MANTDPEWARKIAEKAYSQAMAQGWQCPVCGNVYSPHVTQCYVPHVSIEVSSSTNPTVSKPVEPTKFRDVDSETRSETDAEGHTHRFNGDIHGIPTGKCFDCGVDYQDWLKSLPEKSQ